MALPSTTRRTFCVYTAAFIASHLLAQQPASARPDVAAIDHDRILTAANAALSTPPTPITSLKSPASDPHDFYSEPYSSPKPFTAHRDALLVLSRQIAALTAAFQITREDNYATQAALQLRAWFIDPATRMNPNLIHAQTRLVEGKADPKPNPEAVLDGTPLAEIAHSIPFLANNLSTEDLAALKAWFASYLGWLTTSRQAGLARDLKDHIALSWLLQATAAARLTANDAVLRELVHRFKTVTLRAQLVANGTFPHELATPYPYRNSLFALDLLAGACQLLTSQFDNLWEFELQDGPGLRVAIARYFPYIENRRAWPYPADLDHFTDLPVRNPSLLFAARAYNRPEYAALWKTLPPEPSAPELQRTFPISQPLLWVARPRS